MPFNTRPIGDSPIRRQIAYTSNIATSDGMHPVVRLAQVPAEQVGGAAVRSARSVPPIDGVAMSRPRITDDTASVSRIRYSTVSFRAGSATMLPMTNANTMPTTVPSRKFQWWLSDR